MKVADGSARAKAIKIASGIRMAAIHRQVRPKEACQVLGCTGAREPQQLMCEACWQKVPGGMRQHHAGLTRRLITGGTTYKDWQLSRSRCLQAARKPA